MGKVLSPDKRKLYDSAILFLKDPSIQDAPLNKKLEFLQSKGMSQNEIEEVLAIAQKDLSETKNQHVIVNKENIQSEYVDNNFYEAIPPPLPRRDWKDYFIMTTASVGLCYGIYHLAKSYIVPQLFPETKFKLEQDKELIMEEFNKVEKLLGHIEEEQDIFKTKEQERLQEIDKTILDLQTVLEETTRTKQRIEDEFKTIKFEMSNLQSIVEKCLSGNENTRELNQINEEIISLKNLIKNTSFNNMNFGSQIPSLSTTLPGVDAIPSASEILGKINIGDKNKETQSISMCQDTEEVRKLINESNALIPEWQRGIEKYSHNNSIPEWQKTISADDLITNDNEPLVYDDES